MSGIGTETGLVSVIMPFRNTPERFLREAIASVREQTYPGWELILVNDGSKPEISAVALEIAKSDAERIHYLTHGQGSGRGSSRSRNLGLSHAGGQFIAFLDSDDVWLPTKLEEQLALLSDFPEADMLYGNTLYWYSWSDQGGVRKRDYQPPLGINETTLISPPRMLEYSLKGQIAVPCMCSVIMRRDALSSNTWFEDDFGGMYDDQVLYAKFWSRSLVCVANRCWDKYRQHRGSMTAQGDHSLAHYLARRRYLRWLTQHLERNSIDDTRVRRALRIEVMIARSRRLGSIFRKLRSKAWRILPPIAGTP
jgi:glycosyltransferase involved in cell wall biosynthesis